MKIITAKIEYFPHPDGCTNCEDIPEYYATIPEMKGMGESGKTAKEAFDELMISLKVKIIYDSKISF